MVRFKKLFYCVIQENSIVRLSKFLFLRFCKVLNCVIQKIF